MPDGVVPLGVKLALTVFVLVLVPVYWRVYGLTNFLYFCDLALFLSLGAAWLEGPLLASMAAVGIVVPQSLWVADLLAGFLGMDWTGMTSDIFQPRISRFVRL